MVFLSKVVLKSVEIELVKQCQHQINTQTERERPEIQTKTDEPAKSESPFDWHFRWRAKKARFHMFTLLEKRKENIAAEVIWAE